MASSIIYLENPHTGCRRQAPQGFSWTTLFFGFFPALFRSDYKWGIIMAICSVITIGFSQLIFCFIYNDLYVKDLLSNGYKITAKNSQENAIEHCLSRAKNFTATQQIIGVNKKLTGLAIDENTKKICLIKVNKDMSSARMICSYNELLYVAIIKDGEILTKSGRSNDNYSVLMDNYLEKQKNSEIVEKITLLLIAAILIMKNRSCCIKENRVEKMKISDGITI